jgi:hypothetical protein
MFWGNLVFDQVDLGVIPRCVDVIVTGSFLPLHPRNPTSSESSMEASPEARFRNSEACFWISKARSGVQNGRFLMNLVGILLYSSISLTTFVELYLGSDSMT